MSDNGLPIPVECIGLCAACAEYALDAESVAKIAAPVVAAELRRIADEFGPRIDDQVSEENDVLREVVGLLRGRADYLHVEEEA